MANEASLQLKKIRQNLLAIRSGATPSEMSERIRDLCNTNGYDPVYELMALIRDGAKVTVKDADGNEISEMVPISPKEAIQIHKEMIKYIYPTLKAVDIQGEINANVTVTVKSYGVPFHGNDKAINADFTPLGEKITKNVEEVMKESK